MLSFLHKCTGGCPLCSLKSGQFLQRFFAACPCTMYILFSLNRFAVCFAAFARRDFIIGKLDLKQLTFLTGGSLSAWSRAGILEAGMFCCRSPDPGSL